MATTMVLKAENILSAPSLALLKQLPTGPAAALWKYFCKVLEIPRPSGHLERVQSELLAIAKNLGFPAESDEIGNIVIRKPAGAGFEKAPSVCVQCHMDMVASKNDNVTHDFTKDPIEASICGEWVKANNTTLGADDGIGMATCLALLEETQPLPSLELLFTVEEETTMAGALNLAKAPFLKSNILFNVDNEEESVVCIGCAGGFERNVFLPVEREALTQDTKTLQLWTGGLMGGHTGVDIHKGRGNGIKWMARLLSLTAPCQPRLLELHAGMGVNAIPRECHATVAIPTDKIAEFERTIKEEFAVLQKEFAMVEENSDITLSHCPSPANAMALTVASSQKVVDFLLAYPHGPLRMSLQVEGLVESSIALSIVALKEKELYARCFFRSSCDTHSKAYGLELDGLARLAGATISADVNGYPGWNPNSKSAVLQKVLRAHQDLFNKAPVVMGVHAGLECGIIQERYPMMDCVSIGPEVQGAHSPDERLLISSVEPYYKWLLASIIECKVL